MAVVDITNTTSGLSSDLPLTGVPIGSRFWAYDTNAMYTTPDGNTWYPYMHQSL